MKTPRRPHPQQSPESTRRRTLMAAALASLASKHADASEKPEPPSTWPARALRIVIGFQAGSSPDVLARLVASRLTTVLNQAVTVESKTGASGNIAAAWVAKATDEHTLGLVGNGPLTTSPLLYPKLPYAVATDFANIALLCSTSLLWVDAGKRPFKTLPQFIASLRASDTQLAYGSVGIGSGSHLGMALIQEKARLRMLHVPFAGGPAILHAILGGQVDMTLLPISTALPLVTAGRLRALAVTSSTRVQVAPDVPTLAEGLGEALEIEVWNGIVAPATMPAHALVQWRAAFAEVMGDVALVRELDQLGWSVRETSADALAQRIASDTRLYRGLIERIGLRLE